MRIHTMMLRALLDDFVVATAIPSGAAISGATLRLRLRDHSDAVISP